MLEALLLLLRRTEVLQEVMLLHTVDYIEALPLVKLQEMILQELMLVLQEVMHLMLQEVMLLHPIQYIETLQKVMLHPMEYIEALPLVNWIMLHEVILKVILAR